MDLRVCSFCGELIEQMPFDCQYCDLRFCILHRLPESHNCIKKKTPMKPIIPDPRYTHSKFNRIILDEMMQDIKHEIKVEEDTRKFMNKLEMKKEKMNLLFKLTSMLETIESHAKLYLTLKSTNF